MLSPQELRDARRVIEGCEDGEGYNVLRSRMLRLVQRGLLVDKKFGRFAGTELLDALQSEHESGRRVQFQACAVEYSGSPAQLKLTATRGMTPQFALSSSFQLRPASVYVMVAPLSRPGLCKIGQSFQATRRACAGNTWLPDLAVAFEVAFLDGVSAEKAAHIRFSKVRFVDGNGEEWFSVAPAEAVAYLRNLYDAQAVVREQFDRHVRKALELGLLQSAASQVSNSALQAILNWKLPRQDVTALQAAKAALSSTPAAVQAIALLEKAGLIPALDEEVVLVNFTNNQPLVRYLDRTIGAQRWPLLLEDFAGFSKAGEFVKMSEWHRRQLPNQAGL